MTRGTSLPLALRLAALAAFALVVGCIVDVDLGGSRLLCTEGRCPSGYACVQDRCVPDGAAAADAGDGADPADASAADAAATPDGAPPDGAVPDAAPLSCDEQYGGAGGYELCDEQPDSCEFFVLIDPSAPCSQHCADVGGGACLTAFNADPADPCARQEETGCDAANSSEICVCARGPAGR
jgi:hypothetical protein